MLRTIYLQIALCEFIHQFGSFMEMSCKDGDFKRQVNVWPGGFTPLPGLLLIDSDFKCMSDVKRKG